MHLQDLHIVLKVAEFGNITAAAASLNLQSATASAALKRVEQVLGTTLFIRTTRQLRLSSAGERFLPQCREALQLLERAQHNIRDEQTTLDGELRITLSSDLGRNLVLPWLDELMAGHPKLRLRCQISDRNIDFYRDSVDVALRYGTPSDTQQYGYKICPVPVLLCAAPSYVAQHGAPAHPHQLSEHRGLFYQRADLSYDVWPFQGAWESFKVKMRGNRASNDGDLVRRWCVAGHGVAVKSSLDVADDLLNGRLVTLMPEFHHPSGELWLVFPHRHSITPAARLLRDLLREKTRLLLQQLLERGFVAASALTPWPMGCAREARTGR